MQELRDFDRQQALGRTPDRVGMQDAYNQAMNTYGALMERANALPQDQKRAFFNDAKAQYQGQGDVPGFTEFLERNQPAVERLQHAVADKFFGQFAGRDFNDPAARRDYAVALQNNTAIAKVALSGSLDQRSGQKRPEATERRFRPLPRPRRSGAGPDHRPWPQPDPSPR